jgi:beta-xylosidase
MIFADPKSRKILYAGNSVGAKLRVFELNDDMISFAAEIPVKTPHRFTEDAFMHFRDGLYYLPYSHGNYRESSYSVHYATAKSPTGPWKYHSVILTSDATHKGHGHRSFFKNLGAGLIVYQCYDRQAGNGPYAARRQIFIERVYYGRNGLIIQIIMTTWQLGILPRHADMRGNRQADDSAAYPTSRLDLGCVFKIPD